MKTGISQQLGESSRGTNDSTTVAATGPSNDEDAFARWQAIEAGADPDAPASSQRARQQTPVVDETPGTTATQEDRFVLPGWVTAPRASAFAGVVVLVALAAIGLAWHNWQTSQRWENVADRAIARSSEHASEISLLKAELATSNGDAARLQTQVETLASDSAASADEAALFEQATRAGQTAVDDIVTCVGAQFDLNAVAYQYTDPPTAAMDDRLAQMAEDVSYWCGQAADSAAAFDQAVQFTVR